MNLKQLIPSGRGFITGALTAGVMFFAEHVLHVHLLASSVQNAITPVAAFLAAAVAHQTPKVEQDVTTVIHTVDPSSALTGASLAKILSREIEGLVAADTNLEGDIVKFVLGRLQMPAFRQGGILRQDQAPLKMFLNGEPFVPARDDDLPREPRRVSFAQTDSAASMVAPPATDAPHSSQ